MLWGRHLDSLRAAPPRTVLLGPCWLRSVTLPVDPGRLDPSHASGSSEWAGLVVVMQRENRGRLRVPDSAWNAFARSGMMEIRATASQAPIDAKSEIHRDALIRLCIAQPIGISLV